MTHQRLGILGLGALCLALAPAGIRAAPPDDVGALAEQIDRLVLDPLAAQGARPTRPADDAEFLRRACLDLTGRIPTVYQVREFLDDRGPDKRRRLVERLMAHPLYAEHMSRVWRAQMIPQGADPRVALFFAQNLEMWLREHFRENTPYDALVRDLLTTPVAQNGRGIRPGQTPLAFFQVNELKAENLAASTSRLFLGVKLECAQCHDHPLDPQWKKQQFWEFAAFFAGVRPQRPQDGIFAQPLDAPERRRIKIAGTEKEVEARYLDGTMPAWKDGVSTRATLADWVTSGTNPYFARNAVNRVWAHFFGIGLIEPVDEPGDNNPPSHPELLDLLARAFVAHQFDLKFLARAITASRAYQLSSAQTDSSQDDPHLFARMAVKGLSAEQLWDSLAEATGHRPAPNPDFAFGGADVSRQEFLARFSNPGDNRTEYQMSILQALTLMNGNLVAEATHLERGPTLAAVADAPFFDTAGRIEALYLATLSRKPRPEELRRLVKYVEAGGAAGEPKKALADVFWALLNSSEFFLNH